ncbi:MAG: cyclic nucleotide-binding domain-containing protein [Deltaproteobacteria bacterium]|nr:MAG: cyclic nucleotide-binding domain-containing protein [Deltaproteobacteria bacterium]
MGLSCQQPFPDFEGMGLGRDQFAFRGCASYIVGLISLMVKVPEFLDTVVLFQDLDAQTLSTLMPLLIPKKIKAGEMIFRELDDSDALYVVEQGQVVVSKHVSGEVEIVLTRFYPGDFFGEMGLFDSAPRSASAHAELDTILWRLDREVFHQILSNYPEIAARICYRLVTVFIQRLRATNDQAREAIRWGLEATGYSLSGDPTPFGRKST